MFIKIKNLKKNYKQSNKDLEILKGLNFELESGTSAAILGKSGSGKSTLLSLLAGLDTADAGNILIKDKDLLRLKEKDLEQFRQKDLGVIFQNFHLIPSLSALENVQIALDITATPNAVEMAKNLLDKVGLKDRYDHLPAKLSGGECQRVALARAIANKPKILLADEPSGNLDESTGEEVIRLLFDLVKEQNTSLLLVTHNRELADLCDQVYILKNGVLENVR